MTYLVEQFGLLSGFALGAFFIYLRYALFAGLFFWVLYRLRPQRWQAWKIQAKLPSALRIREELKESAVTAVIFALIGIVLSQLHGLGHTAIYTDISAYGYWYLPVSFMLLVIIHDTYFYWIHRLMHRPRLFRLLHRVHHQSYNPTPWTALAFHPLEAIVEIAILPVVVFFLPVHPVILLLFASWSLLWNVMGHSGYELFPRGFARHFVFRWFNTATHHNMHHARSQGNYGLYFNFWDRMMGTNFPEYESTFDQVKSGSGSTQPPSGCL